MVGEGALLRRGLSDRLSRPALAKRPEAQGRRLDPGRDRRHQTLKPVISLDVLEGRRRDWWWCLGRRGRAPAAIGLPRYTTVQKIKLIEEALERSAGPELATVTAKLVDVGSCQRDRQTPAPASAVRWPR